MKFFPENIYHIYNQGNNQQLIFRTNEDYFIFLKMLREHVQTHVEVIAWCLMPNHFHLLVYTEERSCILMKQGGLEIENLTNGIRKLLSGYARIYNKRYQQTGSLFRQKTKAKNVAESDWVVRQHYNLQDYCSNCFSYIHQNPVLAGLVKNAGDWQFSSYLDYASLRKGSLCNKVLATKYCGYEERDFVTQNNKKLDDDFIDCFQNDG